MRIDAHGEMTSAAGPAGGTARGPLRAAARVAAIVGAAGSVALVIVAGLHSAAKVLIAPFALWVVSPFVVLLLADARSARWSPLTRATLYTITLIVAFGTLGIYGTASPLRTQTFLFVIVPPASWVLIGAALSVAALVARASARR